MADDAICCIENAIHTHAPIESSGNTLSSILLNSSSLIASLVGAKSLDFLFRSHHQLFPIRSNLNFLSYVPLLYMSTFFGRGPWRLGRQASEGPCVDPRDILGAILLHLISVPYDSSLSRLTKYSRVCIVCTYVFSDIACTLHTDWLRVNKPPQPSCRSTSPPTQTWASWDITPPFYRSPKRSSTVLHFRLPRKDPRLTLCFLPLQITTYPNRRNDVPRASHGNYIDCTN